MSWKRAELQKSFIGRVPTHHGTRITMALPSGYVDDILRSRDMTSCKPLSSTGTSSGSDKELEFPEDWDEKGRTSKVPAGSGETSMVGNCKTRHCLQRENLSTGDFMGSRQIHGERLSICFVVFRGQRA